MRLPSIQHLFTEARSAFVRFPEVIVAGLVAAVFGVLAIDGSNEEMAVRAMVAAQLGLPLLFALTAGAEMHRWPRAARLVLAIVTAGLLVAYFFSLPDRMRPGAATRFVQFNLAAHLLASFLPFIRPGRHNGFWQYNKVLFLRFLLSALYSAVVYLGLVVALLAIDKLLGLRVPEQFYGRLWIVVAFLFNTWVFLGGIPRDLSALDSARDYPRGLKVFAQYILIPLVVLYLTILTIYLVKVVVTTEWPSGWIGYLVSSVAVVGILALLLVWPIAGRNENRWVATYTRWFFIFMIPAIAMLLMAIYKRIDQYGITENRYFLMVLAVWLAAVAVYFIVSRGKRIKTIPITLCALALVTSFGPWGAYTVARTSQSGRLERLMAANGILEGGTIVAAPGEVSLEDRRELSSITRYLVEHHGREAFDRWQGMDSVVAKENIPYTRDVEVTRAIVSRMGISYVEPWINTIAEEGHFNYNVNQTGGVLELDGADYLVKLRSNRNEHELGDTGLVVSWVDSLGVVLADSAGIMLVAPVDSLIASLERNPYHDVRAMPADIMSVSADNDRARMVVYFININGMTSDGVRSVTNINADCYVTFK